MEVRADLAEASCSPSDPWPVEVTEIAPLVPSAIALVPKPPKPVRKKTQGERNIEKIEEEIFADACGVLSSMLRFREIEEGQKEVPPAWVAKYGEKVAAEMFRVASASWRSKKDAPIAISEATNIVANILKARARKEAGPSQLNMNMVQMNFTLPSFPERKVER